MFVAKSQSVHQYWCSAEKSNADVASVTVSVYSDYRRKVFLSIPNNGVRFGFAVEDSCGFKVIPKKGCPELPGQPNLNKPIYYQLSIT